MQFTTEFTSIPNFDPNVFFPFFGFIALMSIVGLAIQLLLSYFVYNHAKNNNDPNAFVWALVVFFSTIIGLVIYFLFAIPRQDEVHKKKNFQTSSQPQFDSSKIQPGQKFYCKNCGSELGPANKFCESCGSSV